MKLLLYTLISLAFISGALASQENPKMTAPHPTQEKTLAQIVELLVLSGKRSHEIIQELKLLGKTFEEVEAVCPEVREKLLTNGKIEELFSLDIGISKWKREVKKPHKTKKEIKGWDHYRPSKHLYDALAIAGSCILGYMLTTRPAMQLPLPNGVSKRLPSNLDLAVLPIANLFILGYKLSQPESSTDINARQQRAPTFWERILPERKALSSVAYFFASSLSSLWLYEKITTRQMQKLVNPQDRPPSERAIPTATFKDIAGGIPEELEVIVDVLKNGKKYEELGAEVPKGYLLTGPPGNGKTALARALAGEAGVPFFHRKGSSFMNQFVGTGPAAIRQLFNEAREAAGDKGKAIIFIDEIDTIGCSRDNDTHQSRRRL